MENQSSFPLLGFRRRAQNEAAPQPPQRARGPPIRQASMALGRAGLLPTEIQPQQAPAAPPRPPRPLTPTAITPPPPTPPQNTTTSPRAPAQQQTSSQTTEPPTPPTVSVQPVVRTSVAPPTPQSPIQRQVSRQQETFAPKPAMSATELLQELPKSSTTRSPPPTPVLRPIVTTRTPTPPMSPKVIQASSLTPLPSPKTSFSRTSDIMMSDSEAETKMLQQDKSYKNETKLTSNSNKEQYKRNHIETKPTIMPQSEMKPPSSPLKNAKIPLTQNGKSLYSAEAVKKKDGKEMTIITLAGSNMGALMELSSPYRHYAQKLQPQQIEGRDKEAVIKADNKNSETKTKSNTAMINSNMQSINNSIIFNASCNHRSPGVHMSFVGRRKKKEMDFST